MTTPISAEQWQALRAAGHTDAQIMTHYHYDPKPTPSGPVPGFDAPATLPFPSGPTPSFAAPPTAPLDLSDGKFGVAEGRHPEKGRHTFEIVGFDKHRSAKDGMDLVIIQYMVLTSNNPMVEISGRYSKAYPTRPRANDYGKGRDELKGLLADIAKHVIPGCRPEAMASTEWNATVNAVIDGKGIGVRGTLDTRPVTTAAGHERVAHEWTIGKVDDVGPARAPAVPGGAPALTLPPMPAAAPPMPVPAGAPPLPPMPGAAPGGMPKPPGWMGAWPPGSAS